MEINNILDPQKVMETLHGKKIVIIDNNSIDNLRLLKVGKAYRELLILMSDIENQSPDVKKYISDDNSNVKYLSRCYNIDDLNLSEINETIEALKRVKNEIMNKVTKHKERWDELRKKNVKYYINKDDCQNEEELELYELGDKLKTQFPGHKKIIEEGGIIDEETDEQKLGHLRFLIGDRQIYWRKQDIPSGQEFDIFREYLCLHSRLQKRKQRLRKKTQQVDCKKINNTQTQQLIITTSGFIMEVNN